MKTRIKNILLAAFAAVGISLGAAAQSQVTFSPSSLSWPAGDTSTKYASVHVNGGGYWRCDSTVYSNHFSISPRIGSSGGSIAVTPLGVNSGPTDIECGVDASSSGGYGILWLLHQTSQPTLSVSPVKLSWVWNDASSKTVSVSISSWAEWSATITGDGFTFTRSADAVSVTPVDANYARTVRTAVLHISSGSVSATVSLTQGPNPLLTDLSPGANYIQRTVFTEASGAEYFRDVTYFDGLGREKQSVGVAGSPSGKSIVRETVYDNMGRADAQVYLPFVRGDAGAAHIAEPLSLSTQSVFYGNLYEDAHPFEVKEFGGSPVGRVKSTRKAGDAWAAGTGHVTSISYTGLNASDMVLKFRYVPGAGNTPSRVVCDPADQYVPGALLRTLSNDEQMCTQERFTDAAGKIVCTREYSAGYAGGKANDTYYIYDLRDSLVMVLQPEGAAQARGIATGNDARKLVLPLSGEDVSCPDMEGVGIWNDWCFGYAYDGCGNLIREHIPGGGVREYIYDIRNRLVLKTDTSMSETGIAAYIRTEYDDYDRVVKRSVVRISLDAATLRLQICGTSGLPSSVLSGLNEECVLYEAQYYPFQNYYSYPNSGWDAFSSVNGVVSSANLETEKVKGLLKSEVLYPAAHADGSSPTSGMGVTLTRRYHYDKYGRTIQVVESGSDGSASRTSYRYDFTGNVLAVAETHGEHTLLTANGYDHRGRLLSSTATLDGGTIAEVTYSYDELGRLTGKTLTSGGETGTQTLSYDLHGWQTGTTARKDGVTLFSETLRYADAQKEAGASRYDGNIAETAISQTDGATLPTSTFVYSYDGLKRLTDARRYAGSAGTASNSLTERGIAYDRNGNITTLKRYGESGLENDLEYTLSGNRVSTLIDWNGNGIPQYGYEYDADGPHGRRRSERLANLVQSC